MLDDVLLLITVVALFVGVAYGLFTRKGSGIESHPRSDRRR
jgi:hypothetical protein